MEFRISIVIPVRDDWRPLRRCLNSVRSQTTSPHEVINVDDGSVVTDVRLVIDEQLPFPVKIIRQNRLGVASARNTGWAASSGHVVCFVDADMVLDQLFLRALTRALAQNPNDVAFQPSIVGGHNTMVERMEHLRLVATQRKLTLPDGHIRYAVTGAFALRRAFMKGRDQLFHTDVVRGSDTLLLVDLIASGDLPRYVPDAIGHHLPLHSALRHMWRHFAMGYHTVRARDALRATKGILLSGRERIQTIVSMVMSAGWPYRNIVALALVVAAYALQRTGFLVGSVFTRQRRKSRSDRDPIQWTG